MSLLCFYASSRISKMRWTVMVALVTLCLGIFVMYSDLVEVAALHRNLNQTLPSVEGDSPQATPNAKSSWHKSGVLNGPPAKYFRGNLRNDTYYLTSWSSAGFTNEFMGYVNMIYLATLTDRVPIIPPFAPDHHISSSTGILPFGDVFDLDALRDQLRMHILEWRDVKSLPTSSDPNPYPYSAHAVNPEFNSEPLGCWSTRTISGHEPIHAENVVHHIGVDSSYTRVPVFTRYSLDQNDAHVIFSRLSALIYRSASFSSTSGSQIAPSWVPYDDPETDPEKYEDLAPSPGGHHRKPETQLTCFDTMYYMTSGAELYEWRFGFSPVWRTVGRWVRFNARIEGLAKEYMRSLFSDGNQDGHDFPPFIAVHVRRGDFSFCGKGGCYAQLSAYKEQVDEIKRELFESKGIVVRQVVLMSDETSPGFWEEVLGFGWRYLNHTRHQTLERLGEWYPPIVDIAVQSFAIGLVGTEDSTFSMVSQRRVVDWNGGVIRSVNVRSGI